MRKTILHRLYSLVFILLIYGVNTINAQIPTGNLQLWLKADAGVTKDGSNKVSAWADQSASGKNATQAIASAQPLFVDNAVNGLPALQFDGLGNYMSANVVVNQSSQYSMFVVTSCSQANLSFNQYYDNLALLHWLESGSWGTVHLSASQEGIYTRYAYGNASLQNEIPFGATFSAKKYNGPGSNFFIAGSSFANSMVSVYYNNIVLTQKNTAGASVANTGNAMTIGRGDPKYTTATVYYPGEIAEIIVYNTELSNADRNTVISYLQGKYNIPNATPTETPPPPKGLIMAINCGSGEDDGNFKADGTWDAVNNKMIHTATSYWDNTDSKVAPWGWWVYHSGFAVDNLASLTAPAPVGVYNVGMFYFGPTIGNVKYTLPIPNADASKNYRVRLHFSTDDNSAGLRIFDIKINGTVVKANYDCFVEAGGQMKANIQEFYSKVNGQNNIVIELVGKQKESMIQGIEIYSPDLSGISENDIKSAISSIYPNPVSNENVTIKFNINHPSFELNVSDICGRIIYSKKINENESECILNRTILESGVYIINLKNNNNTANFKLIVN